MSKFKLMKCGHLGYAQTKAGNPYCLICDCSEIADENDKIDLAGRKARCPHCGKVEDSSYALPFFTPREKYNKNAEYDTFDCGCMGWD